MSLRQQNATCGDTVRNKTTGQLLCRLLAALVLINIEGEIDSALAFSNVRILRYIPVLTRGYPLSQPDHRYVAGVGFCL